jgi:hypothetical protein
MQMQMHGCYNAISLWLVQGLAGITVDFSRSDGYPIAIVAGVTGDLEWAMGSRLVPQGLIRSSWRLVLGQDTSRAHCGLQSALGCFAHNVTVPANAVARVLIPAATAAHVREAGRPLPADVQVSQPASCTPDQHHAPLTSIMHP